MLIILWGEAEGGGAARAHYPRLVLSQTLCSVHTNYPQMTHPVCVGRTTAANATEGGGVITPIHRTVGNTLH